jgi:hypothetical protein
MLSPERRRKKIRIIFTASFKEYGILSKLDEIG